jgi:hypothetical protein
MQRKREQNGTRKATEIQRQGEGRMRREKTKRNNNNRKEERKIQSEQGNKHLTTNKHLTEVVEQVDYHRDLTGHLLETSFHYIPKYRPHPLQLHKQHVFVQQKLW